MKAFIGGLFLTHHYAHANVCLVDMADANVYVSVIYVVEDKAL